MELTQEEVWDDTALVRSWDEALNEYKHYHSIAAQGASLNDVLTTFEASKGQDLSLVDQQEPVKQTNSEQVPASVPTTEASANLVQGNTTTGSGLHASRFLDRAEVSGHAAKSSMPFVPNMLPGGVQDEGMKNLMLSWYYAGYYSGLHEGRQKAYVEMRDSKP